MGLYVRFSIDLFKKYFDWCSFGDYYQNEVRFTEQFSVMATEESLKVVSYLKDIEKYSKANALDKWKEIQLDVELIQDEEYYPIIF